MMGHTTTQQNAMYTAWYSSPANCALTPISRGFPPHSSVYGGEEGASAVVFDALGVRKREGGSTTGPTSTSSPSWRAASILVNKDMVVRNQFTSLGSCCSRRERAGPDSVQQQEAAILYRPSQPPAPGYRAKRSLLLHTEVVSVW